MEVSIDPKEFVLGFDGLWNSGNREAILAAVDDSSIVELEPTPPPPIPARYVGREQVAGFVATFLPGFHVDSRNFRREGEEIAWEWELRNDAFRALGADPASGSGRVTLGPGGKLRTIRVAIDEATLAKMAVSRFYQAVGECFHSGEAAVLDDTLAPDFRHHLPGMPPDREGLKQALLMFRAAFPDYEMTVDEIFAHGDLVADRVTWQATHRGVLMGIPPTGTRVTVTETHLARVADGRVVERWGNWDQMGLLQQLGAIPEAAPTR